MVNKALGTFVHDNYKLLAVIKERFVGITIFMFMHFYSFDIWFVLMVERLGLEVPKVEVR